MMIKFSKREVIIFVICLLVVLVYLSQAFILHSLKDEGEVLDQRIKLQLMKLEKLKDTINQKGLVSQNYLQWLDQLGQVNTDVEEGAHILNFIQDSAVQVGINIVRIQTQPVLSKELTKQFSMDLEINGSWAKILEFLKRIQGQPYFLSLDEINLQKQTLDGELIKGKLTVSCIRIPR